MYPKSCSLAFEVLMRETPYSHFDSGCEGITPECRSCCFHRPHWKYQSCVFAECPYSCIPISTIKNQRGIVEPPHSAAAAPKVSEFPSLTECGGVPDHMIVNMGFVDMGADDIGVIALGEALGQLTAQTVRILRCDLSGNKGLPQMVGDHIILAAHSAGLLGVLIFGEKELGIGDPAVALPACYQPAAVCLLRIFGVVDDSADGLSHRAAFAGVERNQACGCHDGHLLEK